MSFTTIPSSWIGAFKANAKQIWGLIRGNFSDLQSRLNTLESTFAVIPTGTIIDYPSNTVPAGFLSCDGSAVSRSVYATLFAVIGTTYGEGDGVSSFNVPDCRGRSPLGSEQGTGLTDRLLGDSFGEETHALTEDENPNHTHTLTDPGHFHTWPNRRTGVGAVTTGFDHANLAARNDYKTAAASTGWSVDDAGSGDPHNNMHPFLVVHMVIKT